MHYFVINDAEKTISLASPHYSSHDNECICMYVRIQSGGACHANWGRFSSMVDIRHLHQAAGNSGQNLAPARGDGGSLDWKG